MGIPIRLAIGPYGADNITLDAVSMDISVDRNVSAFPTPNNILHRMAIDTNVPSVEIEIAGILQDDGIVPEVTSSSGSRSATIINFASTIPTVPHLDGGYNVASSDSFEFEVKTDHGFGTSASSVGPIDVVDRYILSESEAAAYNSIVGNKLFDMYGRTIGTISGITFDYNVTASSPSMFRVDTITLSSALVAVDDGEIMYYGRVGSLADQYVNKSFAIYPRYWVSPYGPFTGYARAIMLKFTSTDSHLSGGSAHPTVTQAAGYYYANYALYSKHARIEVPIGGVFTAPANGNPASTMALLVKEALELSSGTAIGAAGYPVHPDVAAGAASYPADAFNVLISGPTIAITQKYAPSTSVITPYLRFTNPTSTVQHSPTSASIIVREFRPLHEAVQFEMLGVNQTSISVDGFQKSAGDKAQDLIGLISNASKGVDLIRGIQIPYDSLITSSAVTPMARNFFLTFGEQNLGAKGSIENTRNASLAMIPSVTASDMGGVPDNESNETWFTRLVGNTLGDTTEALLEFVGGLISDSMIALGTDAHGNGGGIRIIPEKLHVRYDAGHNYYAFNLKLLASDFVIGV
jgi:hypothetical protein